VNPRAQRPEIQETVLPIIPRDDPRRRFERDIRIEWKRRE
jgi:hypothetical protein